MQVCDEWFCFLSLGDGFHFIDYLGVLLLSIVCFSVILNFLIAFGYMTWVVLMGQIMNRCIQIQLVKARLPSFLYYIDQFDNDSLILPSYVYMYFFKAVFKNAIMSSCNKWCQLKKQ